MSSPDVSLRRLSRRTLLAGLTAGVAMAACSENPATGRRQFLLVSDAQLAALGAQAWVDLQAQTPLSRDADAVARLERIGTRVAQASGRTDLAWEFKVFDSPEVNAFVLPGGKVGFFKGLMDLAQSDDELAAVMGHEVGHVQARHAAERMSQELAVQLGVQLAALALSEEYGQNASAIAGALGMGAIYGVILPYSRQHEFEADALGVDFMAGAAYAPSAAVTFWERMIEATGGGDGQLAALLSTHPASDERLERLRALAAAA
ncbi:MAG: M48 family metallopeptidase [Alphaproteobacteria bacterium]|nr:M48 family metallopeptidase [Alphaproteobacteria bacterium]